MGDFWFGVVCGGILIGLPLLFYGFQKGEDYTTREFRQEIVERDYGEYCSKTGKFAFIGECDEKSN